MSKSEAKTIEELFIEQYELQIPAPDGEKEEHGSLSDEQKKLLLDCIAGKAESAKAAAALPHLAAWPRTAHWANFLTMNTGALQKTPSLGKRALVKLFTLTFFFGDSTMPSTKIPWRQSGKI